MADEVQVTGPPDKTAEGETPNQFGLTAAIALAQMKWRWIDHKQTQTPRFIRDMIIAMISLLFSILFIWYSRNTGHSLWEVWAPFFLAAAALVLGIPVYLAQRHHLTEPGQVPDYR